MTESPAIRQSIARLRRPATLLSAWRQLPRLMKPKARGLIFYYPEMQFIPSLNKAAKVSGKASAWYGRVKKLRKDDPLLSYMHHARNSEEHGIEDTTKRMKAGEATITIREPFDPSKLQGVQVDSRCGRPRACAGLVFERRRSIDADV